MMPERSHSSVALEDLLRLKKAERPPAEFWDRFEQELRAKQLAAIVEKRPWWQLRFSQAWASLARLHLPLGATAILAVTFISVREYRQSLPGPVPLAPSVPAAVESVAAREETADSSPAALVSGPENGWPAAVAAIASTEASAAIAGQASKPVSTLPEPVRSLDSLALGWAGEASLIGVDTAAPTPSERSIAANLAAAQEAEAEMSPAFARRTGRFEALPMGERATTLDPLAQVTSPSESRRARLAAYVNTAELPTSVTRSSASEQVRERVTSRINEQELYDSVRRLGVGGDRLILKF